MMAECECLQVYQRERRYLVRVLRRLAIPGRDIEDVLHEIFLVLLSRWSDYDHSRPVRPWLLGISVRVAAAHRRKELRERNGAGGDDAEDGRPRPDEVLLADQRRVLLLGALAQIPRERRAVLMMREVEGVAMRNIASQLSIPLFTAYSRLRKARLELDTAIVRLRKQSGCGRAHHD